MLNIIVAVDKKYGIGNDNKLPWKIPEEIKLFKEKTKNCVCIVGNKTYDSLPSSLFEERIIVAVSNKLGISFEKVVKLYPEKDIFICGGSTLYSYVIEKYKEKVKIHISFIKNEYECDTIFNKDLLKDFYITSQKSYNDFDHCEMKYQKYGEYQYLDLINNVLQNGERRIGRNGEIISDFCKHLKFDLHDGFPLLTTKKMFLKGIIEELLFFIRGDTNTKILEEKGINIWKGNTSREFLDANNWIDRNEGEMGPMYGSIWRNFNGSNNDKIKSIDFGIDQIKNIIQEIKNNPTSRRLLLTTFNPGQVNYGVLYPCHSITIQFYIQDGFLDMFCYNRSSDLFLGLPFNIASSALFLMIIAQITNLIPRYFNLSLGDAHIYSSHTDGVLEQVIRKPYISPKIILPKFSTIEEVEKLIYEDFIIENYQPYPSIKMKMIV